jgi:hypothetical protein
MTSPLNASTTSQCGPSNEGTYIVLPSGDSAIRSQPPSYSFSQTFFSVIRSKQATRFGVLT